MAEVRPRARSRRTIAPCHRRGRSRGAHRAVARRPPRPAGSLLRTLAAGRLRRVAAPTETQGCRSAELALAKFEGYLAFPPDCTAISSPPSTAGEKNVTRDRISGFPEGT